MSDNILDKIRSNRKRAAVPARHDPLLPLPLESPEGTPHKLSEDAAREETTPKLSEDAARGEVTPKNPTLEELKAELAKIPPTRRHSAIVLEAEIDSNLTRFCKEQGLTVEVFLEAAWLIAATEPELMERIKAQAKRRYDSRKQAGKLRRLITMLSGHG